MPAMRSPTSVAFPASPAGLLFDTRTEQGGLRQWLWLLGYWAMGLWGCGCGYGAIGLRGCGCGYEARIVIDRASAGMK